MTGKWLAALLVVSAGAAWAQDAEETPPEIANWTVYVDEDPRQCWVIAAPTSSAFERDGEALDSVRRDDPYMFISYWPEQRRLGEVSFTGGYPFAEGSVAIEIGETRFDFFSEGEVAWALSADQDAQIIAAMREGAEATMVAQSTRGTNTRDTFTLDGFAAAIDDASVRCAN